MIIGAINQTTSSTSPASKKELLQGPAAFDQEMRDAFSGEALDRILHRNPPSAPARQSTTCTPLRFN